MPWPPYLAEITARPYIQQQLSWTCIQLRLPATFLHIENQVTEAEDPDSVLKFREKSALFSR
jgi:hypothetical protein